MFVGLTGGMACGKSFVARTFAELGAHVMEADELGRGLMEPGGAAYAAIVDEFGSNILDIAGRIDRAVLARIVFANAAELGRLNDIIHPAVREIAQQRAQAIFASEPNAVVIYVAAILIESGGHQDCDRIIVVSCTREQQLERALARPGATEAGVLARLAKQMPQDEKLLYADYVIDSSGTEEDTVRQTRMVYEDLLRPHL